MRLALALVLLGLAGCSFRDQPNVPEEDAVERLIQADALFAEGRYEEAEPHYEFSIKHRWRAKEPYLKLALCRQALGRDAEAVDALRKLLRWDRDDEPALRAVARLEERRGRVAEALEACRHLKTLRPDDKELEGEIARLEALNKNGRPSKDKP